MTPSHTHGIRVSHLQTMTSINVTVAGGEKKDRKSSNVHKPSPASKILSTSEKNNNSESSFPWQLALLPVAVPTTPCIDS